MDIKGVVSIEALLEENLKQRELKEKRRREKEEKDRLRREALSVKKEQLMKTKGCSLAASRAVTVMTMREQYQNQVHWPKCVAEMIDPLLRI
jgi:hypothetical protein